MNPELKPCAHCGCDARMRYYRLNMKNVKIYCLKCGISTLYGSRDDVIERWNRRVRHV